GTGFSRDTQMEGDRLRAAWRRGSGTYSRQAAEGRRTRHDDRPACAPDDVLQTACRASCRAGRDLASAVGRNRGRGMSTPDIFLSYNREDQAVAKRFAEGF